MFKLGCSDVYDISICNEPPEDDNYEEFLNLQTTRKAIHVGNRPFGGQSSDVYYSMLDDFMRSERETLEFLLEHYKVLMYDGNFDIICNHYGILEMFKTMKIWSGRETFLTTESNVYQVEGEVAGYLKKVDNLRMFVMRNAGHMVPLSQPKFALDVFGRFINGQLN